MARRLGKDRAREVNKEILYAAGLGDMCGPESIGSSAGLVSVVEQQPAILLQLDEIGRYLKTLGDAKVSHLYNIVTVLMKLFTSSASVFVGDAYADTKQIEKINQPHLCVYGTTTPAAFYESLTPGSISDGFLSRVLVFEGANPEPKWRPAQPPDLPPSLIEQARQWGAYRPGGNLSQTTPQPLVVAWTPDAEQVVLQVAEFANEERERLGEPLGLLWPRTVEKANKLALLWACSENATAPVVDAEAARWAADVVTHLTQRLATLVSRWISENRQEGNVKRVARLIADAGPAGVDRATLTRKTQFLTRRDRDELLATLRESGQIVTREIPTNRRPRVVLVARQHSATTSITSPISTAL